VAGLEEGVGLDISDALRDADRLAQEAGEALEAALGGAVESFRAQFTTASGQIGDLLADALADVPVTADASAVPGEIETALEATDGTVVVEGDATQLPGEVDEALAGVTPSVPVTADTGPAEAEVAGFVTSAEATSVEVPVTADTTDAEESLDGLAGSGGAAEESLSGTSAAAAAVSTSSSLASGSVDALAGSAANLVGKGGSVGTVLAAGVVTLGGFTAGAISAEGASQRLDSTMGALASRVETIKVGSLNIELADLAVKTGSSGSGMRNAAADAFQLGTSFGHGREESADFSAEILALSARAVALNPNLGQTGDVAETMIRALASGRDRALLPFSLGISGIEINQRAATLALADGREEITAADKAMAGASLASERLGGRLASDIEAGSRNSLLEVRSLGREFASTATEIGRPLVSPTLETLRAARPVVQSVLEPLGQLAGTVLPAVASGLGLISPALGPGIAGFVTFKAVAEGVPAVLDFVKTGLESIKAAAVGGAGINAFLGPLGIVAGVAVTAAVGLGLFNETVEEGSDELDTFQGALEDANGELTETGVKAARSFFEARGQLGELGQAGLTLDQVLSSTTTTTERQRDALRGLIHETEIEIGQAVGKREILTTENGLRDLSETRLRNVRQRQAEYIDEIARGNPHLAQQLRQLSEENNLSPALAKTIAGLADKYAAAARTQRDRTKAGADDVAVTQSQRGAVETLTTSVEFLTGSYEDQIRILDAASDALLAQYDAGFAASRAVDAQEDAQERLNGAWYAAAIAGGENAEANEEVARASRDVEESTLRAAVQLGAKAEKDAAGQGAAAAHAAGINAQVGYLQNLANGLAPDSPLRQFIEQYIGRLYAIPENRKTNVVVDFSVFDDYTYAPEGFYSKGGWVGGQIGAGDIVPARLSPGEFVVSRDMLAGRDTIPAEVASMLGAVKQPALHAVTPATGGLPPVDLDRLADRIVGGVGKRGPLDGANLTIDARQVVSDLDFFRLSRSGG